MIIQWARVQEKSDLAVALLGQDDCVDPICRLLNIVNYSFLL